MLKCPKCKSEDFTDGVCDKCGFGISVSNIDVISKKPSKWRTNFSESESGEGYIESYRNSIESLSEDAKHYRKQLSISSNEANRYKWIAQDAAQSMASASLILGVLSVFFLGLIVGIFAIILGSIAKDNLLKLDARTSTATAGIVWGIVSICLWLFSIIILIISCSV